MRLPLSLRRLHEFGGSPPQSVKMRLRNGVVVALAVGARTRRRNRFWKWTGTRAANSSAVSSIRSGPAAAVDYDRRLVLVAEAAHPRAVVAYSLDDGSVQGVFGGGRGGRRPGRNQVPVGDERGTGRGLRGGKRQGAYLSWSGAVLHQWAPAVPQTHVLCALGGRPAVLLQQGVLFRGDDGESVALGGVASASLELATLSEMEDVSLAYLTTRLACTDSAAYVLESYGRGLTEYKAGAGAALGRDACGIGGSGAHETGVIPPAARLQQPVSGGRWTLVATTHAYVRTHAYGADGGSGGSSDGLLRSVEGQQPSVLELCRDVRRQLGDPGGQPATDDDDCGRQAASRVCCGGFAHLSCVPVRSVSGDPCP